MRKHKRLIIIVILALAASLIGWKLLAPKTAAPEYQTAAVEKGTIVSAVSASGQVAASGRLVVVTQASGVITNVYVKNGQQLVAGQKIASINLDPTSQIKNASAWASYLSAQSQLNAAKARINSLQSTLFKTNQAFVMDKGISNPTDAQKADPVYIEENADWLQAEADYKNQQTVIAGTQAALGSAWLSYQQSSPDVVAPQAGTIEDLTITPGMVISSPSTTTQVASQTIGSLITNTVPVVAVNLSETDVNQVAEGNKVTITLDALPDKTFTGRVMGVNKSGVVSSGVTNYPATIQFDTNIVQILPNMSATANIITATKRNVLIVPSEAVQTRNGQAFVQLLENGQPVDTEVETGISSETETEIVSGLKAGNKVITSTTTGTAADTPGAQSPFNTSFRFGGTGGGRRSGQ